MTQEEAIKFMNHIIQEYLAQKITRIQAREQVLYSDVTNYVNYEVDLDTDPNDLLIADCYYTVMHLTHTDYETTDEEMKYFSECFNGKRIYNMDEKNAMLREYYATQKNTNGTAQ